MKTTLPKIKQPAKVEAKENSFTVVAIGASAGGLEAMIELLKYLPADTGMAFIYVQHLSPDHKSMLTEILSKKTKMIVQEIDDMDKIQPDNVFVIPYNKGIEVTDGHIKLIPRSESSAAISIDILFSSLAEAQKERVIGIILSGSASDGTFGLKDIKQNGGLTFAQDDTAKFTSMPHSAIAAGVVDFILSPKEIALELARLSKHPLIKTNAIKNGGEDLIENSDPDLKSILIQLQKATGVDFSAYKMNTIKRRIIRRMLLYKIQQLRDYAKLLLKKREEIDILYQDLLINVTSFFRDTEAHKYLKDHLFPKLLLGKKPGESLRIWVAACATGEEAYSIAMMLHEILESKTMNTPVHIFATDLSEQAISRARIGTYTRQEMETVSPKRLQRFFNKSNDGFRINKTLRDMCVFATHNVLQDPPFSRLDFISCCNLFIYLDIPAQKKAVNTFHYALNDGGFLMLGKSENITQSANLFKSFSEKYKIFSRKNSSTRSLPQLSQRVVKEALAEINIPATNKSRIRQIRVAGRAVTQSGLDSAIDAVLISEFMPASVVINHQMEIVQFRGTTDLFLTHPKGKATFNILKMARPEIAFELRNGISKVIKTKQRIRKIGIELRINSAVKIISLEIVPLKIQSDEDLLLILFAEQEQAQIYVSQASVGKTNSLAKDRRIKKLEEELAVAYSDALAISQEHEAFTEELQSASEEVVSSNEELQTLNEELETSKEEIESANEELTTTNQELQTRNDLLNESYNYSEAVLSTIHEPMIVLDKNLRVKSANKAFYKKFLVKEEDTEGKHLYDLGNKQWNIPQLKELLEKILPRNANFYDFEIVHNFPFIGERIMVLNASHIIQKSNHEELILLAIADVTDIRAKALEIQLREKELLQFRIGAEQNLRRQSEESETLFRLALFLTAKTVFKQNTKLQYTWIYNTHPSFVIKDILGKTDREILDKGAAEILIAIKQKVLNTGNTFKGEIEIEMDGKPATFALIVEAAKDSAGEINGIIAVSEDITERRQTERKIKESENQKVFLLKLSDALRSISNAADIEGIATKTAMDFMNADRCYYCTREEGNAIILQDAFREGLTSLAAVYAVGDFADLMAAIDSGNPFVINDVQNSKIVEEGLKQMCLQVQVHSLINVPVIKNGKTVGVFVLAQSKPRKWTEEEVQLSVETTERIWAAVERSKAEESLTQSEEKFRHLFTSIDQGFTLCELIRNKDGKAIDMYIREVNPTYEKQTGIAKEMVLDKPLLQIFPSLDKWLDKYEAVVDNQCPVVFENYFEETDRWFAIKAYPIEMDRFAVLFSDITEHKRYESQLMEAKTTAENIVKYKQQFLSNMSHEIRTPLNSILGFTNVLLKTELTAERREYLEAIDTSGKSLNLLISDILDLAKVDAGKMTFLIQPFEMVPSLKSLIFSFDQKLKEKNLEFLEEYDSNIPSLLLGDSARLNQIVLNLVSNALKFTPKGKIILSVRMLNEDEANVEIEFTVTDSGIGIAENKLDSIFKLFEQAEISTANSYGGTGLGLAIVKQLIESQGGSISVKSTLGRGSAFCFSLRFGKTNVKLEDQIEQIKVELIIKKPRVLVVEDILLNQLLIKIILSDFGFEYELVANGKIAIEKLQNNSYDIVLMDLQMPEMNGYEATAYIRKKLKSEIPIIALTADVTTADISKCIEFGMDDYISKPINEKLLYSKILTLVNKGNTN